MCGSIRVWVCGFTDGKLRGLTTCSTSEWISLKDAPSVVASCFKYPFPKPGEVIPIDDDTPKRNIILVGHDVGQDINYLRKIGYDVYNLSNMKEHVDTASMWRYLTRDPNPRNLAAILVELGIVGWNLHNAGNDASYTLRAMIGIAIKAIVDKGKDEETLDAEKQKRVSEYVYPLFQRLCLILYVVPWRRRRRPH